MVSQIHVPNELYTRYFYDQGSPNVTVPRVAHVKTDSTGKLFSVEAKDVSKGLLGAIKWPDTTRRLAYTNNDRPLDLVDITGRWRDMPNDTASYLNTRDFGSRLATRSEIVTALALGKCRVFREQNSNGCMYLSDALDGIYLGIIMNGALVPLTNVIERSTDLPMQMFVTASSSSTLTEIIDTHDLSVLGNIVNGSAVSPNFVQVHIPDLLHDYLMGYYQGKPVGCVLSAADVEHRFLMPGWTLATKDDAATLYTDANIVNSMYPGESTYNLCVNENGELKVYTYSNTGGLTLASDQDIRVLLVKSKDTLTHTPNLSEVFQLEVVLAKLGDVDPIVNGTMHPTVTIETHPIHQDLVKAHAQLQADHLALKLERDNSRTYWIVVTSVLGGIITIFLVIGIVLIYRMLHSS